MCVDGVDELGVEVSNGVVRLSGRLACWADVVQVGHEVARQPGLSNLVCDVDADDEQQGTPPRCPRAR